MARKLSQLTNLLIATGMALSLYTPSIVYAQDEDIVEEYKRYNPPPPPPPPTSESHAQGEEGSTAPPELSESINQSQSQTQSEEGANASTNKAPTDASEGDSAQQKNGDQQAQNTPDNANSEGDEDDEEKGILDKSFKPLITPELKQDINQQVSDQLQALREETKNQVGALQKQFSDKLPDLIKKIPIDEKYHDVINENLNKWLPGLADKANELIDPAAAAIAEEVTVRVGLELDSIPVEPGSTQNSMYYGMHAGRDTGVWRDNLDSENELRGHVLGGFGGYAWFYRSNIFFAAEGFYNYSTAVYQTTYYTYRNGYNLGASGLAGYQLYRGILYFRGGPVVGGFSREMPVADGFTFTRSIFGFQAGMGYDMNITRKYRFRGEYNYSKYVPISITYNGETRTYVPSGGMYTFGVSYHFSGLSHPKEHLYPLKLDRPYFGAYLDIPTHFHRKTSDNVPGLSIAKDTRLFHGLLGGAHIGYSWLLGRRYYLGTEGIAELTDRKFWTVKNDSDVYRNTMNFGGSILPGYLFNPSNLLYVRFGMVYGKFEGFQDNTITDSRLAWHKGFGFETTLTRSISLRAEYASVKFKNFEPPDEHFLVGLNYRI